MDPAAIEVLLPRVLDATNDLELVREASNLRYQYEHFGRKLNTQYELYFSPQRGAATTHGKKWVNEALDTVAESLKKHGPKLLSGAEDLLKDIEHQIVEQSS